MLGHDTFEAAPVPIVERTHPAPLLVAALAALLAASGCSFVVESQDRQCEGDADCRGFDGVCDVGRGVCVERETSGPGSTGAGGAGGGGSASTSTGCVGPDGCWACEPESQAEILNACTDAACIPYDNAQLEGLLLEDGSVPPVP